MEGIMMKHSSKLYRFLTLCCITLLTQQMAAQVNGNKYQTKVTKTTYYATADDGTTINLQNAFDGNEQDTWWSAATSGPKTITINLKNKYTLTSINYYGGGGGTNQSLRPTKVEILSSTDGQSWTPVYTKDNIDRTIRDYTFTIPIANRINSQYFQLILTPGTNEKGEYNTLAMNEITLYQNNTEIPIPKAETNVILENSDAITIHHKAAKWYDLRSQLSTAAKNMDTFNDETSMYQGPKGDIQASHVYMDTIYVHKGTSVTLSVPDKLNNSSVTSYQRWYSYRTDGTFRTQNTGNNEVWDLLTPPSSSSPYRLANGYVGKPLTTNDVMDMNFYVPTDDEFNAWFGSDATTRYDNNYYLVGCDVSGYTDYTKNYSAASGSSVFCPSNQTDGLTYEPTLTHRIIYYIITVDERDSGSGATATWESGMKRLKSKDYQGGNGSNKKFLEEYHISFPYTRISNQTLELVALSKDARSYAIPDASNDNETLYVSLEDNNSGITLETTTLTGTNRIIQFNYPNTNPADNTQYVNNDNSTATIYVTKNVDGKIYNLARFYLTFKRDTRLLTQSQVKQIEDGTIADENLKYYQFRTDNYLEQNYEELTKLNFDYDPDVAVMYGQSEYYQFPVEWASSSYSFYDGANGDDFHVQNGYYPEWGYYAIMNGFVENLYWTTSSSTASPLPNSTYHMYIDASDRAGVIARLPFEQKLCKGSEMFITAWVKSAGYSSDTPDAGMLFSVMGVTKDAVGQDLYVPVYRHASGQIRRTDYLTGGMPGTGAGTNEWYQMYFSFILEEDANYDSYVLQVDNYSESTKGGDMYIDDIRVYMARPSATVTQLEATCTNERTMMNIKLDWDRLLSRLGETEGTDKVSAIDFCFIDKARYEQYLSAHPADYEGAIDAAAMYVGNNDSSLGDQEYNEKYNTLYFHLDFNANTDYDTGTHPRLARNNEGTGEYAGKYFFYETDENGDRALAVDFYSELTPNRSYLMLIQVNDGDQATAASFAEDINDPCGINTPFYVTAQTLLRVNGEVVDPTTDFCAGQIFSFSAQMRIPESNEDGTESYTIVDSGVYFDWFFGTEAEFLANETKISDNITITGVSLMDAITAFREIYPDNIDLTGVTAGTHMSTDGTTQIELTQDMIDLIRYYMEKEEETGGLHHPLVLHKDKLDITLLPSGLQLVIQPIPTFKSPDPSITDDLWQKICWSYIPLELNASNNAPQLHAGINSIKYPAEDFNPCLRIGSNQIYETNTNNPLSVSLRGAKTVTEGAESLGMITSISPDVYNKIYLINTDDPAYNNDTYFPENFSQYSLPIGVIKNLYAEPYIPGTGFNDNMQIYFDTETTQENGFRFQPKEGYTYTFAIHFEEKINNGADSQTSNACFGVFNISMKVVPANLVWTGQGNTDNWNNDANWKRADATDLKNTDGTYTTNQENTTSTGFVPMLFSNVIMPKDSKVELYMAGYGDGGNGWVNSSRPDYMEMPTENIQYDLMAYEGTDGTLSTQRYRVNICNDIHFEPGAQMLHAEQLIYNKAWTDVEITPGQWTAISSPLQNVVAGDWYTPTTGKQETEYFKDITFNTTDNNRLNPAVYQRSWSTGANIVESGNANTSVSFNTEWSAAYNDASVPYTAGGGFSIKAVSGQKTPLLFRFPKADTEYAVSTGEIDRSNSGKLFISQLVNRSDPFQYNSSNEISTTLTPSADGKYLMVGNPFMASMDVQAFMEANKEVLAQKYWYTSDLSTAAVTYNEETQTWSEGTYLLPPYAVFYVEALNSTQSPVAVKFNANMQKIGTSLLQNETANSLKITAESAKGKTYATLFYANSAANSYGQEDAELIQNLDGNNTQIPTVYTVADNKAVSANQVKDSQRIPLGIFASDDSQVNLIFTGTGTIRNAALYDAQTGTETTLYDGFELNVAGATHGRYFIVGNGNATGISTPTEVSQINIASVVPHQIIVTSDTEISKVSIWTTDGMLIKQTQPNGYTCTAEGLDSGIAIVRIETTSGCTIKKVMIK